MHMSFWMSSHIENILFYGCNIHTIPGLLFVCTLLGALAFLFEWIKLLQAHQKQKELILRAKQLKTICPATRESTSLLSDNKRMNTPLDLSPRNRAKLLACDACLWFSLHNIGYLIMLCVMIYNVWLFLSVLIGGGLGYFVFGQKFMKLNIENCNVIRDTYCMATCSKADVACDEGQSTPAAMQTSIASSNSSTNSTTAESVVQVHQY